MGYDLGGSARAASGTSVKGTAASRVSRHDRRAIERVWAKVPPMECKGLCHDSCGPIAMSRLEWDLLREAGGEKVAPFLGADGRPSRCPYLTPENRCSVYEVRPLICRLWGASEVMPCPNGCRGSGTVSDAEGKRLLDKADAVSGTGRELHGPVVWNV
jgi:hypothetical protein